MKLDLNELLQEIYSWKNLLKEKDEEIESLQKQLSHAQKRNEILEDSRASLFRELAELNVAVSALRNSFSKIDDSEANIKVLLEEKMRLKNSFESLQKLFDEESKKSRKLLQVSKQVNKEEATKLISEVKDEASKQLKNFKNVLEEKEDNIRDLKYQINKLLNEKDQDLLKITVQYENKIGKLMQQIPKSKVQSSHGLQMHDIFRQKYLKLGKESGEEIAKLEEQVKSLQLVIESLKSKSGNSSLSSVLLTTNKQSASVTPQIMAQKSENNILSELGKITDAVQDKDFLIEKRKFNKTKSAQPQKRKLFNLNQNYFVK